MAKGFNLTAEINLRGPSNVRNVIADIRRQLGTIDTAVTVKIDPQASNNANKLATTLTRLNNVLTTTSTQSRLTATNISQLANALNAFQTSANSASRSLNGLPRNIAQTTQNIQRAAQQTAAARTELEEFGRQSALAVRRFAAFSLATGAIYSLVNAVSKATAEFIEFDRQIVRLTQITGDSYEQLGGLTRTITGLSTSLGVTSGELIGIADTLAQAGLSARETEQALKALALSALAPSFDSLNETVEGSIALMRQFSISTGDLEKALSSINSVAAAFAVESSDLITAIQRTGGVFASASKGVSEGTDALNEFLAIFTSVRATTRESAETIATGLRTIFTRIQRADTIEALKEYGVTLIDVEGKFVGAYRAVELLAQGLGRLDPRDLKFSSIVEELGGFRQIGKVLPLIQQFATSQEALKVAYAGQGSLATDAAKAQASLSIQFVKTRENFVALIRDVGNSDSFRSLVNVGLTLANTFIKVASVAKPLLPILTSIAAVKGSEALFQFGSGFLGGFARQSPGSVGQNAGQALSGARNQQNAAAAVNNTRALSTNTNALQSLTSAVQQLNSSITNNRRTGPQTINSGGVVRAFARGGVVPGVGNSDTVPAMLQPGEFVIRKKAVETIGAGNLQRMNKYGGGGSIRAGSASRRKRFAGGGRAPEPQKVINQIVRDGDSLNIQFTPKSESYNSSSRLLGIDTYELNSGPKWRRNLAAAAKQETENFYRSNQDVTEDFKEGYRRTGGGKDKYGRPFFANDQLKNTLLSKGLGYQYEGGKKESELSKDKYLELYPQNKAIVNRRNFGGLIQKFAKGGKTTTQGLLMSALKGYKGGRYDYYSLSDILKIQGLSSILDKIEKAYGVSSAKVIGSGGENVAFDIGNKILKISRTGFGIQQIAKDIGFKKKQVAEIGNYQLPKGLEHVSGYRKVQQFGKLTAALQDKVKTDDTDKGMRDAELLQGKLAERGLYWIDAHGSNMGYDKKGKPTIIDGMVLSKTYIDKHLSEDNIEDIEGDSFGPMWEWGRDVKKRKGKPRFNLGGLIQKFAVGGLAGLKQVALRRVGIIDTDVLRDPNNRDTVSAEMEKLGLTDTSAYSIELAKRAATARKSGSLLRLRAIAGAAGSGKSSLATGVGATDDASLRKTTRSQILTPQDIANVDEVLVLTSTASDSKLDAYLRDVDRAYVLSSSSAQERQQIEANKERRDATGQGLYGRKPGTTRGATTDFALDETVLREELGSRAMVLGRKDGSYGLRRKRESELPEIVQAGGFYTGGFAPPTRGHRGALNSLLARMIKQNPDASIEDIVVSVAPNLPMTEGSEGIEHSARYGIFPSDFRALLSQINFGGAMISTQDQPPGSLPKFMEVAGSGGRRRFARLKGAMAVTSGKEEGVLGKYQRAGIQVEDIPRIEDISATKVRDALFKGDDALLQEYLDPSIASILMGNRTQLRNRSMMVPMLLEKIKEVVEVEKANSNAEVQRLLESAPGGPYKNVSAKLRENAPEVAEQVRQIRSQRDMMARGAFGYRAYNVIQALSSQYPEMYALDPNRTASVSAAAQDIDRDIMMGQVTESMRDSFPSIGSAETLSPIQESILARVQKETASRGSGLLPASNQEVLKALGNSVIPNEDRFGKFAGRSLYDHLKLGKKVKTNLPYWFSDYKTFMRRPGEITGLTEEDVSTYAATRDYVIDLFNKQKSGSQQSLLESTAQQIAQTQMLAIVGLRGKNGLQGPLTWNLGNNTAGEPVSVSATIMERVLPAKYKAVADYISEQTGSIVQTAAGMMGEPGSLKSLDLKKREVLNQGNIEGGIFEQLLATLGADVLDDAVRTRAIDFPSGIGEVAGKVFGIDANIPTEAKRTIDSTSRAKAMEEFQRYFRGVYGVPEPEGDLVQQFAKGGKVDDLLVKYKDIIKSIMPAEYIADDGFLVGTNVDINRNNSMFLKALKFMIPNANFGYTKGTNYSVLINSLRKNKSKFTESEYSELEKFAIEKLSQTKNSITLGPGAESLLPHEAFHTIQGFLALNHPQIFDNLLQQSLANKDRYLEIYTKSKLSKSLLGTYQPEKMFTDPKTGSSSFRGLTTILPEKYKSSETIKSLDKEISSTLGANEIIPSLLDMIVLEKNTAAQKLLSDIFYSSGLNANFASTMPQGYFWGGKVDPLAKKYGLSQSEFEEQKKIAKFMGLSDKDFEEKLRLFASQKKRVKGAKFAALDAVADSSVANQRVTAEQQALSEFLQATKFADGGTATLDKPSKNYGKISITEDGNTISAGYLKSNDDRSGYVNAYKMRDYLYYVGLSKATSGYGPRLYDVVMEAATEKGAMLTSDRSSVSGDAKRVWEYYFKNRGDVKKTPLKPDDWTRNQADIDPKLYGREETWPPANDPAWILQSGYSKSPSLINDPSAVIKTNRKQDSRAMALQYFQRAAMGGSIRRFANGGSPEDTVPALLTPGEFVINKKAAQSIGYGKLNRLNQADKLQGYNKGGPVGGIQRFNVGGNVASEAQLNEIIAATWEVFQKMPEGIKNIIEKSLDSASISLNTGDTFDDINLKLRQQLVFAQKNIDNLGPEVVEGIRKILGAGIRKLDVIELDTIRSSSSYKGPGKEYYEDVEKARAGRKVFESGASDAKDVMQAMARSVGGVGSEIYPKPVVKPEDYYSRLDYSDIGPSRGVNDRGQLYAKALAGEDPIKVNALIEKLRKEMEDAARAAGIAISKWGKSESWAAWDIGKQLHMEKNPRESSDRYRLANPLNDAQLQKEIVQRHLAWEATGGRNATTGERLSSADLKDLGARIMEQIEATKAQTDATKAQTDANTQTTFPFMAPPTPSGPTGPGGQRTFAFMSGSGAPNPYSATLPSGIDYNPVSRRIRRNTRENDPNIQERYQRFSSSVFNRSIEQLSTRANIFGGALATAIETTSRFAGSTTVAGKTLSGLAFSVGSVTGSFYQAAQAIRAIGNFADSRFGQRILGQFAQSINTVSLNRFFNQQIRGIFGSSTVGGIATAFGAGTAAAVALTQTFIDYSNALKESRIEEAQKQQERALTKSAEALEKYSKVQDRATLELANTFATSAGIAAINEANARSAGDRRFGMATGTSLGAGAIAGGAIGTFIAPGLGTAIGAAIGGTVAAAIAQSLGADRTSGTTAEESSLLLGRSRSSILEVFNQRFTTGETSEDIMRRPEWNAQRQVLARSNAEVEAIIRGIQSDATLTEDVKKARIEEALQIEASAQLRQQEQIWLRQKGLIDLDNATKAYTRSLKNMFANMDEAINRSSVALENFNTSVELAEASVKGQARIGVFKSETSNIIRNPRASTNEERAQAASVAGSFFGSESGTIRELINIGPKIESAVLASIQAAQTLPGSTTDEAIAAAIRKSVRAELTESSLPQDLSDKLGQQIAIELEKRRKSGDDKVDFRDLEEAIPQLKDSIDALKGAQDIAIKALEDYAQKVGILVDKTNTSVELLVQAGDLLRKASEIRFNSASQLSRTFGSSIDVNAIQSFRDTTIRNQTGGPASPEGILDNINRLENRRAFQQNQLQSAQDRGRSGARDVLGFTDQLSRTTRSLRDNQKALEDLAANSEQASAALEKISEVQAKTQAGQNIIERYLTSTREDNFKLSSAFERLDNNMRGMVNDPFASRNVFEAMRDSDNPVLAADQAIAQDRRDTLEAFNMLAPFLGDTREQNTIKANVLETMLQEAGIGMTPMFNEVIKSLRNPENNSEMSQLVEQYKEGIKIQSKANELLAELNTNFAQNLKQSSEEAFKNAITDTLVKFEEAQVSHLQKIEEILSKQTPAAGLSSGGVVYRNIGGSIFQPKGTDTVPAMLTPGEFVVNKSATQKYGSVLNAINTNTYARGGKVKYYATGGYVSSLLKNETGFTSASSEAETKNFGLSSDFYQNPPDAAGKRNKNFSKNRHFDPGQLTETLRDANTVRLMKLTNNPSIIPLGLNAVGPDAFPLGATSSENYKTFENFINDGVSATSVGIGFYPRYKMALNGTVLADNAPNNVQVSQLGPAIPEALFKNIGTIKERFLEEREAAEALRLKPVIDSVLQNLDLNTYQIYNQQKYTEALSSQLPIWYKEGKSVIDFGGGIDNAIFTKAKADLNKLEYTKGFGEKALFLVPGTSDPVVNQKISALNRSGMPVGFDVNNLQITTGDPGLPIYGAGGFTVDIASRSSRSGQKNLSVLPPSKIYRTSRDSISENLEFLQLIRSDFEDLEKDSFGPETIYSNQYALYQNALSDISKGLIEKAKFNRDILDQDEVANLSSVKGDRIDLSKLTDLYVWSKRSFDASKIKTNPRFKNATNIGSDFPIKNIDTNNIENFVWSLSDSITGSDFLNSVKPFLDPKQYLINETFSETFDAPWAIDKKINVEFPYKTLKKLPIFDFNNGGSISKEYNGFGLYADTFNMLGDNKTINPFKLATTDYNNNKLLLTKTDASSILSNKIKQWINSNGGQVPTKAVDLQLLSKLVQLEPSDLDIIPEDNDLSRETAAARRDIFGAKGSLYQQLAGIGVLYREGGEANFGNLDLDPSMVNDFKDKVDLNKAFATNATNQRFPAYANGLLNIKNELVKSKESLLEDFINQSSISNLNLSDLAPWVKNLQDSRIGDLFSGGPEVPDNLRKVYLQTLGWDKTQKTADLMNATEAKYPGAFQELMSLLQLGFYVNGGKTAAASNTLSSEFNDLQKSFFGTEDLDKLSVFEDSRVAGKRGKQWWKAGGPDWAGFARYNLSIISRKGMIENIQNILNKASQASFNQQDANDLAEDIQSLSIGATGSATIGAETPANNLTDLLTKALDTTKIYTEGYRLDIADAIQKFNMPGGVKDPNLDRIKSMIDPSSDLLTYLAFKDAILSQPISSVQGIKVQGDDRDIKAPRLSNYALNTESINGVNPWSIYETFLDNAAFTNVSNAFNELVDMIGAAGKFTLQDPRTIYQGPVNTFDSKLYENPDHRSADPIKGTGAYTTSYKALAGTIYATLFEKAKKEEALRDSTTEDSNVIYRSKGGSVGYYNNGGSIINFQPRGTDTIPAMLTPGEFVINRQATQKHLPLLQAINSQNYQTGGVVKYLQNGSQNPVSSDSPQDWIRQFVNDIRSASDEDILGYGNSKQTMSLDRFKQFVWDLTAGRWAGFGGDIPRGRVVRKAQPVSADVSFARPNQTSVSFKRDVAETTWTPSSRSMASQRNRQENPYMPPAEDPTAYSPSSRAQASRRARESYKPQYSAESYISDSDAINASQQFEKEYKERKERILKRELMLEEGPTSSINLSTPTMTFEKWDRKNRTDGRIVAYDAARQFLAILKIAGTDIMEPEKKTAGVTAFPINLLGPSSQESVFSLLSNRELSVDDPYPYQKIGINEALNRLEKEYGSDFVKQYRSRDRISKISTNAGLVYDPNQGYIASKLSDFLLSNVLEKQKKFAVPTAEAVPVPDAEVAYTSTKAAEPVFPQKPENRSVTNVSDEISVLGQEFRKWIDVSGKYNTIAKLMSFVNQSRDVKLNKNNNKNIVVPIDKLSSGDKNYLNRVKSSSSSIPAPKTSSTNKPESQQVFNNVDRLWYGGRLWDLNNDGIESEKIVGRIDRILDAERIMIDTNSVPGGSLILRREFMNQEDLDTIKAWENQRRITAVNKQTGGMIYASNGQLINFQPRGTDTVPAMLTPGEFVVNRQATQKNLPLLQSINNSTSNSKSYMRGGIIYAADGAYVRDKAGGPRSMLLSPREAKKLNVPYQIGRGYDAQYFDRNDRGIGPIEWRMIEKADEEYVKSQGRSGINYFDHPELKRQKAFATVPGMVASGLGKLGELINNAIEWEPYGNGYKPVKIFSSMLDMISNVAVGTTRAAGALAGLTVGSVVSIPDMLLSGTDYLFPGSKDAFTRAIGFDTSEFVNVMNEGAALELERAVMNYASLYNNVLGAVDSTFGSNLESTDSWAQAITGNQKKLWEEKMALAIRSGMKGGTSGRDHELMLGALDGISVAASTIGGAALASKIGNIKLAKGLTTMIPEETGSDVLRVLAEINNRLVQGQGYIMQASEIAGTVALPKDIKDAIEASKLQPDTEDPQERASRRVAAVNFARGGLVSEVSGLYQSRLTTQKNLSQANDQWFVVPLKAGRGRGSQAGDTSKIFDANGNILPSNELLTYDMNKLATIYGNDSKLAQKAASTKYPWFDAKQHRLVMGQGIYRNQKTSFSKQDPALKLIDELAYEYKAMPDIFEIKNKEAYTDENIDSSKFLSSLKDSKGNYVKQSVEPAAQMLKDRSNFLTTLFFNLEEALDIVDAYINKEGRDSTLRSAFAGEDPDNILSFQKTAVGSEINNIDNILKEAEINQYAQKVKNKYNQSRILNFGETKNLKSIVDYFTRNKKPEPKTQPTGPVNMAVGGFVPSYYSSGSLVNFAPKGTDTVPAMLTPGEFVINKRATQKNLPLLKQINSQNYQRGGVVKYYQQGTQTPVQQTGGLGSMYSLSLDDKSISLIREFTSRFSEFSNKLANLAIPSLKLDETTLASLNNFTQRFDNFTKELLKLNIPPVITITGKHDVNVNINGASVFSNMDKYVSNMIKNEINNAFAQLARETDGAISMNYNPSAYSNQNSQNMA